MQSGLYDKLWFCNRLEIIIFPIRGGHKLDSNPVEPERDAQKK